MKRNRSIDLAAELEDLADALDSGPLPPAEKPIGAWTREEIRAAIASVGRWLIRHPGALTRHVRAMDREREAREERP